MKKLLWSLMGVLALAGCNGVANEPSESSAVNGPLESLAWLDKADAKADAVKAIAAKDYRLWVLAGRGEQAPGLSPDQQSLKERCGKQYLPGSTDVVINDEHMAKLVELHNYAAEYNQLVAAKCTM